MGKRPRNNPEASCRENRDEALLGYQNKGIRKKRDLVVENDGYCPNESEREKRYRLRCGKFCGSSELESGSNIAANGLKGREKKKKKRVVGFGVNTGHGNVGCFQKASEVLEQERPEISKQTGQVESSMCHQCQRSNRGEVVRCSKCKTKRFCRACIQKWYPHMSDNAITVACPVCLGNCTCKPCLR